MRPGVCDTDQTLAAALENRHAKLFFQQADLLGYAGLRGGQGVGGGRHAQVLPFDFHQIAQLLELHIGIIEFFRSNQIACK